MKTINEMIKKLNINNIENKNFNIIEKKEQMATYIVGICSKNAISYEIKHFYKKSKIFYGDILEKEKLINKNDIITDNIIAQEYSNILDVSFIGCKGIARCEKYMPIVYVFSKKKLPKPLTTYDVVDKKEKQHYKEFVIIIKKENGDCKNNSRNNQLVSWNETKYQKARIEEIINYIQKYNLLH